MLYISTTAQVSGGTSSQTATSTNLDFSLDVTSGDAPLKVNVAVTERPGGEGWTYNWIFNDGPIVEGDSATHVYNEPAKNNIILLAERNEEVRTATQIVDVTGGAPEVIQVPLRWNKEVFPDAFEVIGLAGRAYLDSSNTIPAYTPRADGPKTPIAVLDRSGEVIAYDSYIPGVKEYFTLDPADNLKAEIYTIWVVASIPREDRAKLYTRIDQEPRFSEAVEILEEAKRYPLAGEELTNLVVEISKEVARQYYQPNNKDIGAKR